MMGDGKTLMILIIILMNAQERELKKTLNILSLIPIISQKGWGNPQYSDTHPKDGKYGRLLGF